MYTPAIRVHPGGTPALADMRDALEEAGAIMAGMTGSGSALFGVFLDEDRAAEVGRIADETEGVAAGLVVPTLVEVPGVGVGGEM